MKKKFKNEHYSNIRYKKFVNLFSKKLINLTKISKQTFFYQI